MRGQLKTEIVGFTLKIRIPAWLEKPASLLCCLGDSFVSELAYCVKFAMSSKEYIQQLISVIMKCVACRSTFYKSEKETSFEEQRGERHAPAKRLYIN